MLIMWLGWLEFWVVGLCHCYWNILVFIWGHPIRPSLCSFNFNFLLCWLYGRKLMFDGCLNWIWKTGEMLIFECESRNYLYSEIYHKNILFFWRMKRLIWKGKWEINNSSSLFYFGEWSGIYYYCLRKFGKCFGVELKNLWCQQYLFFHIFFCFISFLIFLSSHRNLQRWLLDWWHGWAGTAT